MCGTFFKIYETNVKIPGQYISVYGRDREAEYADQIKFLTLVYFTLCFIQNQVNSFMTEAVII